MLKLSMNASTYTRVQVRVCARARAHPQSLPADGDIAYCIRKGEGKKQGFSKSGNSSGGRTICPRGLSFSQLVVLMCTINYKKDSRRGQTVLPPEPPFFENPHFFPSPFSLGSRHTKVKSQQTIESIDGVIVVGVVFTTFF